MDKENRRPKKRAGKVIHSAVSKHAIEKAAEIRNQFGPDIDYYVVQHILEDRKYIRYPVQIKFVSHGIEAGLFGKTELITQNPADGYLMSLHSYFKNRLDALPALILYQSVLVNYGDLATAIDAELFGAGVLGLDRESYYEKIVTLTNDLWSNLS